MLLKIYGTSKDPKSYAKIIHDAQMTTLEHKGKYIFLNIVIFAALNDFAASSYFLLILDITFSTKRVTKGVPLKTYTHIIPKPFLSKTNSGKFFISESTPALYKSLETKPVCPKNIIDRNTT